MERASSLGGRDPNSSRKLDRLEVHAPAWRVHLPDLDLDRVAEPDRSAAARAVEDRPLLVQLPPVAAQAAHRQQALMAVAETHERPDRREADHLPLPYPAPAGLDELALEQEAAGHVVGVPLDRHRLALAPGRPGALLPHARA